MTDERREINERRTDHIEWRLDNLEAECVRLGNDHSDLKKELQNIAKIIFQVKWLIVGAIVFAVSTEVGIVNAIKTALILG